MLSGESDGMGVVSDSSHLLTQLLIKVTNTEKQVLFKLFWIIIVVFAVAALFVLRFAALSVSARLAAI